MSLHPDFFMSRTPLIGFLGGLHAGGGGMKPLFWWFPFPEGLDLG